VTTVEGRSGQADEERITRLAHENLLFLSPLIQRKTTAHVGCDIFLVNYSKVLSVPEPLRPIIYHISEEFYRDNYEVLKKYFRKDDHVVKANGVDQGFRV
jgi:hypothetical protein